MSALRKNVASQVLTFNLVNATTGAALTGAAVTTKVALDGTQSGGAGTVTELGTGQYKYVPSQAETNGASVGFSFTAANAVPVNLHCFTIGYDPTLANVPANATQFAGQTITAAAGVTIPSSIASPTNITAATGVVLSAAGVQAIWDALTSALTTVNSIGKLLVTDLDATVSSRMATFTLPSNFSSLVIDSTGRVNAFLIGILTSVFTEGATGRVAAAFKQFFNIATPAATMDHGVLIDTVTTLTNAPSDSSGVTTLLSRLSATRAGYLDNLSAGAVALEASLQGLVTTIGASAAGVATAVWSAATRVLTAGTNIVLAKGVGVTGFNDLSAAQVNTEADTALADVGVTTTVTGRIDAAITTRAVAGDAMTLTAAYDAAKTAATQTSVDDLPTNAELATALGTADDATLAAIAALTIPSLAAIAAQITTDHGAGSYVRNTEPPTAVQNRQEMDSNSTRLAAIDAKTTALPASPAAVGDVPTASQNAAAVRTNLEGSTPIPVNTTRVNSVPLTGDGNATPWGPA